MFVAPAMAGTIILEGNYQGKNIYVQNPFSGTGVGFCTYEVRVNGDVSTDEINSSAFEIDLANFQFNIGDKLTILIKHKDDCKPKVLNPEVLKPKSTFEAKNLKVDAKSKVFTWTSTGETGKLPYIVEQFRWNKWIKVGEVEGVGTKGENTYSFQVTPHSGENKFRVKQVDYTGRPRYSSSVRFREMETPPLDFVPKKVRDELKFVAGAEGGNEAETMYEIYDSYGNIVKKGFGATVDCKNLKGGVYYLNYDNSTDKFIKK